MVAVLKKTENLETAVLRELRNHPALTRGTEIQATIEDGVVTLRGRVDCLAKSAEAERSVARIPGVARVRNEIRIVRSRIYDLRDIDLRSGAELLVHWHYLLRGEAIDVGARAGWVVLTGTVASDLVREEAERAVSVLPGLVGVQNLIVVRERF